MLKLPPNVPFAEGDAQSLDIVSRDCTYPNNSDAGNDLFLWVLAEIFVLLTGIYGCMLNWKYPNSCEVGTQNCCNFESLSEPPTCPPEWMMAGSKNSETK